MMNSTHKKLFALGLKLFSTNVDQVRNARVLFEKGEYNYIELYVPPDTYSSTHVLWRTLSDIPFVIHAPHFAHGMNLADSTKTAFNRTLLKDSQLFADVLGAGEIIIHPGFKGSMRTMLEQARILHEPRLVLENVPQFGLNGETCTAFTPAHFAHIKQSQVFNGIVVDIGHAFCVASALQENHLTFLQEFIKLKPVLFHLSDGVMLGIQDAHKSFGEGDFPLRDILDLLPDKARITIETPKNFHNGLHDFSKDVSTLGGYV